MGQILETFTTTTGWNNLDDLLRTNVATNKWTGSSLLRNVTFRVRGATPATIKMTSSRSTPAGTSGGAVLSDGAVFGEDNVEANHCWIYTASAVEIDISANDR